MTRHPTLAYVFLRNSTFGPNGAAAVELCVRDLIRHSRFAASTLVVCPKVDEPFEGVAIETVPDAGFGGNLGKAWAVGRLLKRRGVEVAVVENHLPAAAVVAAASGLPVILHSHAYEKAAHGALKRAERAFELNRLAGLAFCSEDCLARFRIDFPGATAPMRAIPNGLDMREWSSAGVKEKLISRSAAGSTTRAIVRRWRRSPGRCGHGPTGAPGSSCRRSTASRRRCVRCAPPPPFGEQGRIDANLPYAEVKRAWARASVGMALTKSPEPFGRTALEALASGAALVASGLGGLAEVCGRDALTVDPVDPEAVAAALAALVDAPDVRETFARRPRPGRGAVRHGRGGGADGRFSRGGFAPPRRMTARAPAGLHSVSEQPAVEEKVFSQKSKSTREMSSTQNFRPYLRKAVIAPIIVSKTKKSTSAIDAEK